MLKPVTQGDRAGAREACPFGHSMKTSRHILAAAVASALIPLSASAVSLGDLTVESRPGEPLDAVLMIDDVDVTVSPLLVRVAPPATYLREGVQWPEQAQDLRITRDRAPTGVSVRVVGDEKLNGSFPLLIELNAGGAVTVRQYEISAVDGSFRVTPIAERTTVRPVEESIDDIVREAEAKEAVHKASEEKSDAEQKPRRRQGRWAPLVVKEYVAEHGFDAEKPFKVGRDMTLWSIAKLYHPSYAGATMEQTLVAFMDKNPKAFPKGDVSALTVGAELVPPTADEVFAIDPEEAFRKIRGGETIPPVTAQLIEAQKRSRALAAEVARVQQAERDAGRSPEAAAAAAAPLLAAADAPTKADAALRTDSTLSAASTPNTQATPSEALKTVEQKALPTAPVSPEPSSQTPSSSPSTDVTEEEVQDADSIVATGSTVVDPAVAAAETSKDAQPAASTESSKSSEPAEAAAAPAEEPAKSGLGGFDNAWLALVAVLAAILGVLFILRRKKGDDECADGTCSDKKKGPAVVKLSRDVPMTSDAQLTALKATVDEAVKNGTTGGAMGAGTMAYQQAQREEAMREAEAKKEDLYQKQPWLVPDEGMDAVAKAPAAPVSALDAARLSEAAAAVSALDLTEQGAAVKPASVSTEAVPLFKVSATMRPVTSSPLAVPAEPAAPAEDEPKRSPKEQALSESMEAQLKLAESFIGLGALPEAKELLAEVRRHGLEPQRERAAFLLARIESAGANR